MDKVECFKIQILECDDIFDISKGNVIKQINCSSKAFVKEPKTILADPFLFVKDAILFLFYEDKKMYKPGVISMVSTKDLIKWTDPIVVLEESCHLSYPWVFQVGDNIYMIPETCEKKSIRLYKANKKLTQFTFCKTILQDDRSYREGFSFSDSSIWQGQDGYYLMTTINNGLNNILELYYCKDIFGKYKKHIKSPITVNNAFGRNAGCLFEKNGHMYRVTQNCEHGYGNDVSLLEVETMSSNDYKEHLVKSNILGGGSSFYKNGGHQYNWVHFKGKNIVATDAKEYHSFWFPRIFHKIGFYKR